MFFSRTQTRLLLVTHSVPHGRARLREKQGVSEVRRHAATGRNGVFDGTESPINLRLHKTGSRKPEQNKTKQSTRSVLYFILFSLPLAVKVGGVLKGRYC